MSLAPASAVAWVEPGGGLPFQAELDQRCQRGLHWRYAFADPLFGQERGDGDAEALAAASAALHERIVQDPRIVHCHESWGTHRLHRFVLPFRFELRVWTRPGELSFIHRATAHPDQRAQDRAAFEGLLRAWWTHRRAVLLGGVAAPRLE